jgi:U3 small nucleolar RNA-associated protein 3
MARRYPSRSTHTSSFPVQLKTLAEEIEGRPEEVREDDVFAESQRLLKERARLQARAEAEEELFTRVPLTKAEKARQKSVKRSSGMADMLDDFNDDVADLVAEGAREEGARFGAPPEDLLKRKKMSQVVMEEARPEKRARVLSGEALTIIVNIYC